MDRFLRSGHYKAALILAGLVLLLAIAASCSIGASDDSSLGGEQHLRLAGSAFGISTLDPALVRDVETAFLSRQVFRGLMSLDSTLQPVPDLASDVEVLENGMRYRFRLHPDLQFHNGNPIDADAVVSSFNRASNPDLGSGDGTDLSAATYFSDIEGIGERLSGHVDSISGLQVVDDLTVDIILSRPAANFLLKMTGAPAFVVDVSTVDVDGWWNQANGSGPFIVESFDVAERLVLVANREYPGGGPRLDKVTVLFGSQSSQPLNLYEAGSIDVTSVPGWAIDRVQSPGDPLHPHLIAIEQMSTTYLAFNMSFPPYDDDRVRRAIASGFDVDRLVELSYSGRVARAAGMIPPGVGDREWESDPVPFDLAKSRDLLDESAGRRATARVVEPGGGVSSVIRAVLQRDLDLELVVLDQPWPDFAERLSRRDLPALVLTWVADYPDPENTLATLLRTGSPDNFGNYSNPEFDRLVDEAAVEQDQERRAQLYLDAQQIALDDVAVIPLYHGKSYTVIQPWVQGLEVTEIGILSLENVWIESELR
jgi:oligopeptide transport system substrate-binding protein